MSLPQKIGHFIKPQVLAKEEEEEESDEEDNTYVDVPEDILENYEVNTDDLVFDPLTAKVYNEEFKEVGFFIVFKDGKFENVMTAYDIPKGETFALQLEHDRDREGDKRFRIKFRTKYRALYTNPSGSGLLAETRKGFLR